MSGLADKRLVFVTGKGGVGRSTVAVALALAAARRGLRAIVAELSGQTRAAELLGAKPAPGRELRLAERLWALSVDPDRARDLYLRERAGRLGDLLAGSRAFRAFVAATPGLRELIALGAAWELAQDPRRFDGDPYDLVVVDAPATGHGLGVLRTPRTFAEIARVGPIAHQGATIDATLTDPAQTAVLAVALPEEMPVTETIALERRLADELGITLAAVVVNACLPRRLGPRQAATVAAARERARDPLARAALAAALAERERALAQREQVARLANGVKAPLTELPYVFAPLDRAALAPLADALEALL